MRKDKHLFISAVNTRSFKTNCLAMDQNYNVKKPEIRIALNHIVHGLQALLIYALYKGVPLTDIIKAAEWSNSSTFDFFYNKPLSQNTNKLQMIFSTSLSFHLLFVIINTMIFFSLRSVDLK